MVSKNYKHMLAKPETHQKLKIYCAENELNSFDEAFNKLLGEQSKNAN